MTPSTDDIPTSLDELIRDSRARIERLHRRHPNNAEFDHVVRSVIEESLQGYDPQVIRYTLRVVFGY